MEWIVYDITDPIGPIELKVKFDGNDVKTYTNTVYKMDI
jgi:hypothetical protein